MRMTDEHADVVIVTALKLECDAVLTHLQNYEDVTREGEPLQYLGLFPGMNGQNLSIVVATNLRVGMTDTAINATRLADKWRPQVLAMTGIAAGTNKTRQNFGDIVVATECFDYGSGKWTEEGFSADYRFLSLDASLGTYLQRITEDDLLFIYKSCSSMKRPPNTLLQAHQGPFGSGAAVIARKDIIDFALKNNRNLQGIDMEAYAIFRAAHEAAEPRPKALVIKSISDFADETKSDDFHQYAASTSAECLFLLLGRFIQPHDLPRMKTGIRDYYLRQDKDRRENHPPLDSAKKSICLIGGSLRKYALDISEMKPKEGLTIKIVLPDPKNEYLIEEWMKVIPEEPSKYCKDVIYTLENLKSRINELNIDLRLSSKLHITTTCIVDDKTIIIEVNSYKCLGRDRLMVEVDRVSHLGDRYSESFNALFNQGKAITSMEDYEATISAWRNLMTPSVSRTFLSLKRELADNQQFEGAKIFAHTDSVLRWLLRESVTPITLELDLTLACNDTCPRCTYGFAHQGRFLEVDHIRRILDDASELGIRGLTLTGGGDPLKHPETLEVFNLIKQYEFSAGLFTNGGLIQNEVLAEALVSSFDWIRVSLDAASESNFCKVRGHAGYQQRLECLSLLSKARATKATDKCEIGISFLTSSETAHDIVKAAVTAKEIGYDYIQFKPMIEWTKANHHLSTSLEQRTVFTEIQKALDLQDASFRVLFSREKYESEVLDITRCYSAFHCAWFVISVGPNTTGREVTPTLYLDCSSKYIREWTIGEFSKLSDILESSRRKELISRTTSSVFCVPSEKHAVYNHLLEKVMRNHTMRPYTTEEILKLAPASTKHPYSL